MKVEIGSLCFFSGFPHWVCYHKRWKNLVRKSLFLGSVAECLQLVHIAGHVWDLLIMGRQRKKALTPTPFINGQWENIESAWFLVV